MVRLDLPAPELARDHQRPAGGLHDPVDVAALLRHHVYVYGSTPQVVYTGYTPGYYGMVVTPSGLVVYGTGYVYPAWAGTVRYPLPATDGAYAAGYGAGVFTGFAVGMAFDAMAASAPWGWHGGCCWGGWKRVRDPSRQAGKSSNFCFLRTPSEFEQHEWIP